MNNNLNNRQWKAFRFEDIFVIKTGANVSKTILKDGLIPRITAKDTNNGIDFFTERCEHKNFRTYENCVSISFLGSCFYQPYLASYDMKIHNITVKGLKLNKYVALFLANQCKRTCTQVTYGNQMSSTDLRKQLVYLPVTPNGKPDWNFMEDYMKQIEHTLLQRYKNYIYLNINNIEKMGGGNFNLINWKAFYLTDVFSLAATQSSIDRINLNGKTGIHPYITRTDNTNGWDGFVDIQNGYHQDEGNVITIGLDTQTVFYQPIPFYTGQNIQILRHQKLNRYSALFVIPLIKMQMKKFNWGGNGATLGRLNKLRLILPTTQQDTPDWNFMENYMRYQELIMIRKFIDQRLNEIA